MTGKWSNSVKKDLNIMTNPMTYKKETCKYGKCEKCKFIGYMMIGNEQYHKPLKDYSNRPPSTPDLDARSFLN